jgi:O-antigen/teichoic acid export membrane protein
MHRTIVTNTFYQILSRGTTAFITFLITLLLARTVGVEGFGEFTKITSYIAFFYLLVDFGLNAVFLQQYEKERYKQLFFLRIILSVIAIIIANSIAFLLPYNVQTGVGFSPLVKIGIGIFSFSLVSQAIILSASAIFQKNLRYIDLTKSTIVGSLVTLLCVVLVVELQLPFYFFLVSFIVGTTVTAILSQWFISTPLTPFALDMPLVKKMLTQSTPLLLMLVFNLVYFKIDILLLSFLKPTTDVGIYGLAYRFFDFLIALPLFLSNSLYPLFLTTHASKFRSTVLFYVAIAFGLAIVIVVPFWFLSPLLVLIKEEFADAISPLRFLLLSLPLFFATSIVQWALIAQKKQTFLMWVYLAVACLNMLLNALFIPYASYNASAIITGVSEGLVLLLLFSKLLTI